MAWYLAKRAMTLVPVWLAVVLLAFLIVHSIPGGPFDTGALRSDAAEAALRAHYNLDAPLFVQYIDYIAGIFQGDLGASMVNRGRTVTGVIGENFAVSAILGGAALVVAVAVGVPLGILAARRRGSTLDVVVMSVATAWYAIPSFVAAMVLILVFGQWLEWFPLGGWGGPENLILPALALGLPWAGMLARMTRVAVAESLAQPYIQTALAKGCSPTRALMRHAVRNALLPLTTVLAILAAELVTGSLVIEQIFGLPGLGKYMIESVLGSDYTMTLGLITFYATIIFIANFAADITYGVLDPRVRHV